MVFVECSSGLDLVRIKDCIELQGLMLEVKRNVERKRVAFTNR